MTTYGDLPKQRSEDAPSRAIGPAAPLTNVTLIGRLYDAGDMEAWRTFVDLYSPLLYRYCRGHGLQDADAWDVVQDVFAAVQQVIGRFKYDPRRGLFRNWLLTITIRQIYRVRRREQRLDCPVGDGAGDRLAGVVGATAEAEWVEDVQARAAEFALDRIREEFDPDVWKAFKAVWFEGRQPADVARELNKSPDWVYRARYEVVCRWKREVRFLMEDEPSLLGAG